MKTAEERVNPECQAYRAHRNVMRYNGEKALMGKRGQKGTT